jgi:Zn-finger nucleic acid-binding protein
MICPRCDIEMVPGQAIQPDRKSNVLYIAEPPMINFQTLRLIEVLKCPQCGYSDDGVKE